MISQATNMKLTHLYVLVNLFGVCSLWLCIEIYIRTFVKTKTAINGTEGIVREFTKMPFGRVFLFGAAAGNTSQNASWDVFTVYASTDLRAFVDPKLECCFKHVIRNESNYDKVPSLNTAKTFDLHGHLKTVNILCPHDSFKADEILDGVGLTIDQLTCKENDVRYIKPFYPKLETRTMLGISTQVAFGNINAELLIEWMETYIYLGVDKVITYYTNNLNSDALKTLQHYSKSGILELHFYQPAASDLVPRDFTKKIGQTYSDLRLAIYDAFARSSGYAYFGIIDFDEFLIPSQNRSLKQMLEDLFRKYPDAAGFKFKSQLYSLTWGPSSNNTDMILTTYVNRIAPPPRVDRPKNIVIPRYIRAMNGVHHPSPKKGRKIITVPDENGYLRHFRKCRVVHDRTGYGCSTDTNRVLDRSVAELSKGIKDNVHKVRKQIFGKEGPVN